MGPKSPPQPAQVCPHRVYPINPKEPSHPCRGTVVKDGYCASHHPDSLQARAEKAEGRRIRASLHQRRLLLIPVLDEAEHRLKGLKGSQRKGAEVVVTIIRNAIREGA